MDRGNGHQYRSVLRLACPSFSFARVGGAEGAAARMRMNRTTLISRMKRFGIEPRQYA
jgi:transcriptional regulator with GAF, ATPase, and Fis domain